jgi:hypothetical protein
MINIIKQGKIILSENKIRPRKNRTVLVILLRAEGKGGRAGCGWWI